MTTYTIYNASNLPVLTTRSWPKASQRLHDLSNSAGSSITVDGEEVCADFIRHLRTLTCRSGGYRPATPKDIVDARACAQPWRTASGPVPLGSIPAR